MKKASLFSVILGIFFTQNIVAQSIGQSIFFEKNVDIATFTTTQAERYQKMVASEAYESLTLDLFS